MRTSLRSIAIHVEQGQSGTFRWVLSEWDSGPQWLELRRAPAGVASYKLAMAQGLVALESMIDDLDQGPRRAAAPAAAENDAAAGPKAPAKPSFFGFGPAR